jgi:hypothetical protein
MKPLFHNSWLQEGAKVLVYLEYCKPTFIRGYFISRFLWDKMVHVD